MKKLITLIMSLLIMTTMMSINIHADDTGTITEDGGSQDVDIASEETVEKDAVTSTDVFRVSISWSTTPACYSRKDGYIWNAETLNYDVLDSRSQATKSSATSSITITNYSNTDIDYDISFTSKKADDKDIASEAKASDSSVEKNGTIASADKVNAIIASGDSNGNSSESVTYKSTISYADDYVPEDGDNSKVGTYSVAISKAMALSDYSLYLRVGKTATLTSNKTVTWSSSDTSVATVNASTGLVTAIAAGTATITATDAYNRSKTCSVIVRPASYYLTASQDDFDLLLASDTVEFTYNNKTYTAYNGFIKETQYATWYQAQEFVNELNAGEGAANTAKVLPNGVTDASSGKWILLTSAAMGSSWIDVSVVEGVYGVWTNTEIDLDYGIYLYCGNGKCRRDIKSYKLAFVVIWEPAN